MALPDNRTNSGGFWPRRRFLRLAGVGAALGMLRRTGIAASSGSRVAREQAVHRFHAGEDFQPWQTALRRRLSEILVLRPSEGPLNAVIEPDADNEGYTMDRIRFDAEPGEVVTGFLLRPKRIAAPVPVMICLQGHSPGVHISIGRAHNAAEREAIAGGRDLALQAVENGWAALAIEQRGFGTRAETGVRCNDAALRALHQGRPLTGQRVFDVMRTIDFIATQRDLDASRIGCAGNSTGGTVSFYAAAIDPRIHLAVVSCSFCTFEDSWLSLPHCACGYLPGIMQVADMPDLGGLIAPRRLLIVAGKQDPLARFAGVEKGFRRTREIFAAAGCEDRVRLAAGEGGHQFYPKLAWPVVAELVGSQPGLR